MITVVEDKNEIERLYRKFNKQLNKRFTERITCWVGYPSGANEDTVGYSRKLNLWVSVQELHSRFWNGFGIGEPIEGRNNSLSGEINFPYEGINRQIAGAFAKEEDGKILVLHRGKIGGGKKGVGKWAFVENFRGDFVIAIDGDRETEFCLVGELDSPLLPEQVGNFIYEINRIKKLISKGEQDDFSDVSNYSFTEEKSGKSKSGSSEHEIVRTHGIIVNALATELTRRNFKTGNNRNMDLFIHDGKNISTLFEIKTSLSTQSLYSAVGQLLIYSIPLKKAGLIFVTPDKLKQHVEKKLESWGISVVYYTWDNETVVFEGLNNILKQLAI